MPGHCIWRASPYKSTTRRNGRFFNAGIANATPAKAVAEVIAEALLAEQPKLRYPVSFGSEIMDRRVALSTLDDGDYYQVLRDRLGIELEP